MHRSETGSALLAGSDRWPVHTPALAGLAGGTFAVVWQTDDPEVDGDGAAIMAQVVAGDGSSAGSFRVNSGGTGFQSLPAVAGLSNGTFVVTWQTSDPTQDGSQSAIKAQIFGADGTRVGNAGRLTIAGSVRLPSR